jgi:hypothetical protein
MKASLPAESLDPRTTDFTREIPDPNNAAPRALVPEPQATKSPRLTLEAENKSDETDNVPLMIALDFTNSCEPTPTEPLAESSSLINPDPETISSDPILPFSRIEAELSQVGPVEQ